MSNEDEKQMTRPWTPHETHSDGSKTLHVKRCCEACGRPLGDATQAVLDAALAQRTAAFREADERCLTRLHRAGFNFRTAAEAIAFQERYRELSRANAALVSMHSIHSRRGTGTTRRTP